MHVLVVLGVRAQHVAGGCVGQRLRHERAGDAGAAGRRPGIASCRARKGGAHESGAATAVMS